MLHITLDNFSEEVIDSQLPVILDFYADWCGPCQMMGPVFESVSKNYKGKLKFAKVDTSREQGLSMKYGIQGIPCLIILNKGEEIGRIVGLVNETVLKSKIDAFLKK